MADTIIFDSPDGEIVENDRLFKETWGENESSVKHGEERERGALYQCGCFARSDV